MENNYKIPKDILSEIPDHFWAAFAGELVSIFGVNVFDEDDDMGRVLFHISSTNGWNMALKATCRKLGINWLYIYYDNLSVWDSDLFDGEIEDLVISKFVEDESNAVHVYYSWLFGKEEAEE